MEYNANEPSQESQTSESQQPSATASQYPYRHPDSDRKSSALATMLSLCPGLGQVYVGDYAQGFINVIVVGSLIAMLNSGAGGLIPLLAFFLVFYWLYNMVDAGRRAASYNLGSTKAHSVDGRSSLPDDQAALLAGVVMVFFGTLFLGHTLFGFTLDWLETWWPMGLIALGLYLIYRSVTGDKSSIGAAGS